MEFIVALFTGGVGYLVGKQHGQSSADTEWRDKIGAKFVRVNGVLMSPNEVQTAVDTQKVLTSTTPTTVQV